MKKLAICLCLMLASVLLFAVTPALATSGTETMISAEQAELTFNQATEAQKATIIESLSHIESIKADFGLKNVDFSNIRIGNKIHFYNYVDGTFIETPIGFPLIYNGEIVAIAREIGSHFQISTELVPEIRELGVTQFAMIYDVDSCYVFNGTRFYKIYEALQSTEGRGSLASGNIRASVNTIGLQICNLAFSEQLEYNTYTIQNWDPTSAYVHPVERVPQTYNSICWAATTACIKNSIDPTADLSAVNVAVDKFGYRDFNQSLSPRDVAAHMRSSYNMYYVYASIVPTDAKIIENIVADRPLYASCRCTDYDGGNVTYHGVTVYGINDIAGYVLIVDPQIETVCVAYKNNGEYSYVTNQDRIVTWTESIYEIW